jgi:hypothetical protein
LTTIIIKSIILLQVETQKYLKKRKRKHKNEKSKQRISTNNQINSY